MKATCLGIKILREFNFIPVDVWETEDGRRFGVDHGDAIALATGEVLAEENTNAKAVQTALKVLADDRRVGRA